MGRVLARSQCPQGVCTAGRERGPELQVRAGAQVSCMRGHSAVLDFFGPHEG